MSKYLVGPFTVSKPTNLEDLKLIQYVFDSSLNGSEIVVQCKNYYLTRGELRSLRPRTWLDDNVLSTMSDAVTLVKKKMKYPVNWYLPISFAENTDDPRKCISFAEKHRIKENYMSDLLCCEKVLVRRYLFLSLTRKEVISFYMSYN